MVSVVIDPVVDVIEQQADGSVTVERVYVDVEADGFDSEMDELEGRLFGPWSSRTE